MDVLVVPARMKQLCNSISKIRNGTQACIKWDIGRRGATIFLFGWSARGMMVRGRQIFLGRERAPLETVPIVNGGGKLVPEKLTSAVAAIWWNIVVGGKGVSRRLVATNLPLIMHIISSS